MQSSIANSPVVIVVTARLQDNGQEPTIFSETILPSNKMILPPLQATEIMALAENRLGGKVHPEMLELLQRMTNGNAFYLEQMLAFFSESKLLTLNGDFWNVKPGSVKLSNSMNAILTARIDRLSKLVRETVKTAAVIGREFDLPILSEVLGQQEDFVQANGNTQNVVRDQIQTGERSQIWRAMSELRYIFQQSLLRDSIYDMQLRARLRELHLQVAQAIEKLYKEQLQDRLLDLAYHYEQAGVTAKNQEYLIKAADYARRNYQNTLALECYQKIETNHFAGMSNAEKVSIFINKGVVEEAMGRWIEATDTYQRAHVIAQPLDDKLPLGRANNSLGYLLLLRGDYENAQPHLADAEQIFAQSNDYFGLYKALANLGNLYFRQSDYAQAKRFFQRSLNIGAGFQTSTTSAQIAINLGLTLMNLGDISEGANVVKSQLAVAEKEKNRSAMAALLTNLGILQSELGFDEEALESYQKGMKISEEIGNKQLISIALGCIGSILERRGEYATALDYYRRDLDLCQQLGDQQGTAICYGLLGNLFARRGKIKKALFHLKENLALCKKLKYGKGIVKARKDIGTALMLQGNPEKALAQFQKAIAKARSIENRLLLGQCLLSWCQLMIDNSQYTPQNVEHIEAFELAARLGNKTLEFQAALTIARVHHLCGEQEIAIQILDEMKQTTLRIEQLAALNEQYYHISADKTYLQNAIEAYHKMQETAPQFAIKRRIEVLTNAEEIS